PRRRTGARRPGSSSVFLTGRDNTTTGGEKMFEGFETRDLDTGGARIRYVHGGTGAPLLLLHGNPLTHVSWHKIANQLAERFHVVAADLRGYGDSSAPDAGPDNINYSFRAMAQDQVDVMKALGELVPLCWTVWQPG
ncbi:MAG TPA: alpha/beta fold hydrolase, partial [Afifellaceae bacterium]|nr:alpha/beta fold hydrolase [Afifellaceae bacterium]